MNGAIHIQLICRIDVADPYIARSIDPHSFIGGRRPAREKDEVFACRAVSENKIVGRAIQISIISAAGNGGRIVRAGIHAQVYIIGCLVAIISCRHHIRTGVAPTIQVLDIQLQVVIQVSLSANDVKGSSVILINQQSFRIGRKGS